MKSLYELDCSTVQFIEGQSNNSVPFYDNQADTIRDLHQLDSFYGIENLGKRDDLLQQAVSSSCETNLIEESQGTMVIVSPTSPSLFENCTKKLLNSIVYRAWQPLLTVVSRVVWIL